MAMYKSRLFIYFIIYSCTFCHAKYGFKYFANKVNNAVNLAINYAVLNETLSFKEPGDFTAEGESFKSYTLEKGGAIKFYCGNNETEEGRKIKMYPEDLKKTSLAPMSKSGITHSIKRVINNFGLFRSDSTLIYSLSEFLGGGYLIQYPADAVIVSSDPNFSLNFACVYDPNYDTSGENKSDELNTEEKKDLLYRWIEVKFTDVLPISYGCGSGNHPLFNNLSPENGPDKLEGTFLQTRAFCEIEPKPGMVIGIYCAAGETFNDEFCFRDSSGKTYYDPDFKYDGAGQRLHLFRVPENGFGGDVYFLCECRGKNKDTKAQVKIIKASVLSCDLTKIFEKHEPGKKISLQACRRDLRPGESLKVTVPKNYTEFYYFKHKYSSLFEPINVQHYAYRQKLDDNEVRKVKLSDLIVGDGLTIEKTPVRGAVEYLFKYNRDSILILTSETVSFEYFWTLFHRNPREREVISYLSLNEKVLAVVSIGLFPTDPYTYGCGVRNDFFRRELLDFRSEEINNKPTSICKVDGRNSPIGFYCPRPFLLEPRDCFRSVLIQTDEGEESVDLVKVAKYARHFTTKHLVILDTYTTGKHEGTNEYINTSEIMCKCVDEEGNLVASITVQLDKDTRTDVGESVESDNEVDSGEADNEEGSGDADNEVEDSGEVGGNSDDDFRIETRIS